METLLHEHRYALQYSSTRLGVQQMTLMRLRVLSSSRLFKISYSSSVGTVSNSMVQPGRHGCRITDVPCSRAQRGCQACGR